MLKKIVNEAYFTLQITTTGPLLIRSGRATVSGPDMTPVVTYRDGFYQVFLPGSSLKGVFRSHLEKVIGSLRPHVVCYPFAVNASQEADPNQRQRDYRDSCGTKFERGGDRYDERSDLVYADSCPACRLFGSTGFIGRVAISDAYLAGNPLKEERKESRDGVGIDRLTGGASHGAKFELEVVSSGVTFETDIHLRNFELWQLGMLFVVVQDMEDGLIRIGSGRSRGLGWVKAKISQQGHDGRAGGVVTSAMRESAEPDNQLWGLGRWLNDGSYGTWKDDFVELSPPVTRSNRGIRSQRVFTDEALANLQIAAINHFVDRIRHWPDEVSVPAQAKNR